MFVSEALPTRLGLGWKGQTLADYENLQITAEKCFIVQAGNFTLILIFSTFRTRSNIRDQSDIVLIRSLKSLNWLFSI
jgi:hypothetical protein